MMMIEPPPPAAPTHAMAPPADPAEVLRRCRRRLPVGYELLLLLVEQHGNPGTLVAIGETIGADRRRVQRLLRKLEAKGLLTTQRGEYHTGNSYLVAPWAAEQLRAAAGVA